MRDIFIMDTGLNSVECAEYFVNKGDRVFMGGSCPQKSPAGVNYVSLNPVDEESLNSAVKLVSEYTNKLYILVIGALYNYKDEKVCSPRDYDLSADILTQNVFGARRVFEVFLPMLRRGLKRVASITEVESSVSWTETTDNFVYYASLAGINMTGRLLFNIYRPEGFTFRWYTYINKKGGLSAGEYIDMDFSYDPTEPKIHNDEDRFVLRDGYLREYSW